MDTNEHEKFKQLKAHNDHEKAKFVAYFNRHF